MADQKIPFNKYKNNNNKEWSPHCQQRHPPPEENKRMRSPSQFLFCNECKSTDASTALKKRAREAIEKEQQDSHNNIIIAECGDLGTALAEKLAMITRSGHCRC